MGYSCGKCLLLLHDDTIDFNIIKILIHFLSLAHLVFYVWNIFYYKDCKDLTFLLFIFTVYLKCQSIWIDSCVFSIKITTEIFI